MNIQKAVIVLIGLIVFGAVVSAFMWNVPIPSKPTPKPVAEEIKKDDRINVTVPFPKSVVSSPLSIMGSARGFWFFEASFPIELYDANGKILGTAVATAGSDWMTEDFVPFAATLTYENPTTDTGKLVLRKDNPSGDPVRDDSVTVEVRFR